MTETDKPKHPGGRPSDYCQETTDTICERLSLGESLRSICRDPDMPCMGAVLKWLNKHEEFVVQYTRAREIQADTLIDETLDIADESTNDWMERRGQLVENGEAIQRSRLRIDTRKWIAGKMRPKKYGERTIKVDEDEGERETVIRVTGGPPARVKAED